MKRVFTSAIISLLFFGVYAGFNPGTMKWQNKTRKFTIYVPDIYYTAGKPVPLLLGLHGFGDNIDNFSNICITSIADTANYIAVYAEALPDPILFANAWNSGASLLGNAFNGTVDDVGFLNALMDTVIARYSIDTTHMYAFGFSFGAFMTNRMASEKTSRFAAVAAVSGLRGNLLTATPSREMPIVYFHGTYDQTINYYSCPYGLPAEKTLKYWVNNNHCDLTPEIDSVPDIAADNKTIVHYTYKNGTNGSRVEFYKVIGGEHEWLGLPKNDISYCQTIWKFFREFKNTPAVSTGVKNKINTEKIALFPNPGTNSISFKIPGTPKNDLTIHIYNPMGVDISNSVQVSNDHIGIDKLASGMYFISVQSGKDSYSGSFVKQ